MQYFIYSHRLETGLRTQKSSNCLKCSQIISKAQTLKMIKPPNSMIKSLDFLKNSQGIPNYPIYIMCCQKTNENKKSNGNEPFRHSAFCLASALLILKICPLLSDSVSNFVRLNTPADIARAGKSGNACLEFMSA